MYVPDISNDSLLSSCSVSQKIALARTTQVVSLSVEPSLTSALLVLDFRLATVAEVQEGEAQRVRVTSVMSHLNARFHSLHIIRLTGFISHKQTIGLYK